MAIVHHARAMRTALLALLLSTQIAATAAAKNMYIPAAAHSPGRQNTLWRTDVRIYNPSPVHDIGVTLHFLPQGMDGTNIPGRVFSIGKRQTLVLDDVVATLLPEMDSVVGAIRIDSDTDKSYEFIASSRTYTNAPFTNPGTYGQFVPALDMSSATTRAVILHAAVTQEFRTNVGVMNPGYEPVTVKMKLVGIEGADYLESPPFEVPPKSMRQWSTMELFGGFYVPNVNIVVGSTLPVFSWASVVDNISGDAIFVRGMDETHPEPRPIE